MRNMPGYFIMESMKAQGTTIMSYTEFYDRGKEYALKVRESVNSNSLRLKCACDCEKNLGLTITNTGVIRVAENEKQDEHLESCPKSIHYNRWLSEHENGVIVNEKNQLCFNITIPSGIKKENETGGSSTTSESKSKSKTKTHAPLLDMISKLNAYAWEKQTYSIKKQIKTSISQGDKPDWNYKELRDFHKLIYGVSNEIFVYWHAQTFPLANMLYFKDKFYESTYKDKYLMYARIEKIGEYNEERKYQYITVNMPSMNSPTKAVIRVLTEDFNSLIESLRLDKETGEMKGIFILTGYIRHDTFTNDKKEISHWITLLKGSIFTVSSKGLYCRHMDEARLYNALALRKVLYKKPIFAIEEYGHIIPTLMIERKNNKPLIVDVCKNSTEYLTRTELAKSSKNYEYIIVKKNYKEGEVLTQIFGLLNNKNT